MTTRNIFCAIISLSFILGSCSSEKTDSETTQWGISPTGEAPDDLHQQSEIIATDKYPPFTKKLTVCGMFLVGGDDISNDFMKQVAKTIKEIFPQGGSIDAALQEAVLTNLYSYRTMIPFFKENGFESMTPEEQTQFDYLTDNYGVCDIIVECEPGPGQVNEVVEHILHHLTDIGLHYTFPREWGMTQTSEVYQAMQEAIDKGHYDVSGYDENDAHYLRIIIQEFAYWVIFTAWDLFEPYGPEAEWTGINNPADLQNKLPLSYQLFRQTIPKVMVSPSLSTLDEFTKNSSNTRSRRVFTKQVEVFGLHIYATNTTGDDKLLHAANILAEYIDNDEDGIPDNPKIMKALIEGKGAIVMSKTEAEITTGPRPRGQGLYDQETIPNARAQGRFDASLEEILHMVSDVGWAGAYPEVFGRVPGTGISNALDKARGGRFIEVPEHYPEDAWFSYDDKTCDYDCQNSEYIYWVLTSILGAQDFPGRYQDIKNEWRLNTKEKVKKGDPAAFALFTDPKYKFPTVLPDGKYKAKTFTIQKYP